MTRTPTADYLYRAEIKRAEVATTLASFAVSMDYDNEKGAVGDAKRACMMGRAWATCLSDQHD